ncbi:GDSL-type esterase/lipase family protein [Fischerella thermalis]|uniref:G-D-S-L family lipolytic protein n=1 Tax=Fischerella thermalis CCMEE 5318 TaxID=2019666 RepID=A0A2N6LJA9_9CYAN|nr:GDSL-type esterase/lipase family protein [Fischerella thermalis]PMB24482.1 G-D-S-L family lipolytic protein [Fischerella thermalis CCMEE 5318]PMB42551.1 G-D-S-L family lipolytic protein [Fischerella thermalis CCMEE 5319]
MAMIEQVSLTLLSYVVNIFLLVILILLISNQTRLFNIVTKVKNILNIKKSGYLNNYPPYYWHKLNQFTKLPQSESDIIMLGDSITDEGEWIELLSNINVKNRGISGDTTERVLYRLDSILSGKPKEIFLMLGINDLINTRKSVAQTLESYEKILHEFREKTLNTKIFIQSVLPVNNKIDIYWQDNNEILKLNTGLRELATKFNYQYIDLFSLLLDSENQLDSRYTKDGLHLNGEAYLVWKSVIEKYL